MASEDDRSSTAHKAARGVAWMIATTMGGRMAGLLSTLVMTRFLAPEVLGAVAAASIVTLTAGWLSTWGFGQYAVVKGRGDDTAEVTWHATVAYAVVGFVGLGAVAALAPSFARMLDEPAAAGYIRVLALAAVIRRFGAIPERVLSRSLRFRSVGLANALGEVGYAIAAVTLAAFGWRGNAIVAAHLVQSIVASGLLIRAAGVRSWATPTPLRW